MRELYLLPLIAGSVLFVGGNLIYASQIAAGTYRAGSPLDISWTLGLVLFGIAALLPNRATSTSGFTQNPPAWLKSAPGVITGSLLLAALAALVRLVIHPATASYK